MKQSPHIVIVGGGAGGIELATRLGHTLGRKGKAKITLVDQNPTHLWKPLLHEVAAGTLDANQDELNYFVHASSHYYHFQLGRMIALFREQKEILLAPIHDAFEEDIVPERKIKYDILVLALGSITNDFGIPGVKEHCVFLDDRRGADRFQQLFLKYLLQMENQEKHRKLAIVIIGAGATGVELAAELRSSVQQAKTYGLEHIHPEKDVSIKLIEAAKCILPMLPERISKLAMKELHKLDVSVETNEQVTQVFGHGLQTASGKVIPATMIVWAVGVTCSSFADKLDGLELNKRNQIVVNDILITTRDTHIFAFGDCAQCPQPNNTPVPPRAQAATQQATLLAKSLVRYINHKTLLPFVYKDYGSLVSLSHSNTLANIMGKLLGSILFEGKIARLVYVSLYKKHQSILHGCLWVYLQTISNILTRRHKPRLKLH